MCVASLALFAMSLPGAQGADVKLDKEWKGSVADADKANNAPECIATEKAFKKLWKSWGLPGKVPDVDFAKQIVVLQTTSGSNISLSAKLDDKGDLKLLGIATADFGPGFRYIMASVSRKGVKTVNGKKLPE
jgi:hypothetical protein